MGWLIAFLLATGVVAVCFAAAGFGWGLYHVLTESPSSHKFRK